MFETTNQNSFAHDGYGCNLGSTIIKNTTNQW